MANLNMTELIKNQSELIQYDKNPECIYSQMLTVPFGPTESGGRGLIAEHQYAQIVELTKTEPPVLGTGHENDFGDRSSSVIQADTDLVVLEKICKYEKHPNNHYFLIVLRKDNNMLDIIERKDFKHNTETYGSKYNNEFMDSLEVGYEIPKGSIIRKSNCYDEYMNAQIGTNIPTVYINSDWNTEDSCIIDDTGAEMLAINLFHKISITKNANDILLNILGDNNNHKSFADINEKISNGILLAMRKVINKESPYMQSNDRLKTILMSDDTITITGDCVVMDIDVFVNNPNRLANEQYNSQILEYYNDSMRFINEFISAVNKYGDLQMTYDLANIYNKFLRIQSGEEFGKDNKRFSDVIMDFYIYQHKPAEPGDKIANRFGGKGVISLKIPDAEMIRTIDGRPIHMIMQPATMHNRENGGQCYELEMNALSEKVLRNITSGVYSTEEQFNYILQYIRDICPEQADYIMQSFSGYNIPKQIIDEGKDEFIQYMIDNNRIPLDLRPIRDTPTIDQLSALCDKYTDTTQTKLLSPIRDSNGNIRFVESRRSCVASWMYFYPMKQYGEEKWSVTSMSSTNIRNENSRNKANASYKALHPATPIKFGDMEAGDLDHMGPEELILYLMLLSLSPHGRRKVEELLVGNPYEINIKVDDLAKNRSVEIINAYLKALGLRLRFVKKLRRLNPAIITYECKQVPMKLAIKVEDPKRVYERQKELSQELASKGICRDAIILTEGMKDD